MEYRVDKYLAAPEHRYVHGYIIVVSWLHYGYIVVISCGYIMVTSWLHRGYIMVTSWLYHVVTSWLHHGYIVVTSWLHRGYITVTSWIYCGYIVVTGSSLCSTHLCFFFLVHTLLCEGQHNLYGYGVYNFAHQLAKM